MAYDERLESRLILLVQRRDDIFARKMFGGVGFLLRGNMCFGIWKDSLILRLDIKTAEKALLQRGVRPFDITGRPMRGWILVEPSAMKTTASLKKWVNLSLRYVAKLPRK